MRIGNNRHEWWREEWCDSLLPYRHGRWQRRSGGCFLATRLGDGRYDWLWITNGVAFRGMANAADRWRPVVMVRADRP